MSYTPTAINEAYWRKYTEEASKVYTAKMLRLGCLEHLKGTLHHRDAPNHLMYKVDTLYSKDGHRAYEFLLEYDVYEPTVGIYYGCKGLTLPGFDHGDEIEVFKKEWAAIKAETCTILNNTFPGKDFVNRLKATNNANDNTFWPFWISLYEEEDIRKVGLRAVTVIRNVYKRFLDGEEIQTTQLPKAKLRPNDTAFTEEAYRKFKDRLAFKVHGRNGLQPSETKTRRCVELFEQFLDNAEKRRMVYRDSRYEWAWRVQQLSNIDFIRLIGGFFQYLTVNGLYQQSGNDGLPKIPWKELCNIILAPDGSTYNESLKTQRANALSKNGEYWLDLIQEWLD